MIFAGWGTLQIRTRRYKEKYNTDRHDVSISRWDYLLLRWQFPQRWESCTGRLQCHAWGQASGSPLTDHFPLGYGYLWGGFTAQLLIALRIIESNPALAAPIAILGFIFFADTATASLADWLPAIKKVPGPVDQGSYLSPTYAGYGDRRGGVSVGSGQVMASINRPWLSDAI